MLGKALGLAAAALSTMLVFPALAGAIAGTAMQSNTVTLAGPGFIHRVAVDVEVPGAGGNVTITLVAKRNGSERTIAKTIVKPGDLVSELPAALPKVKIKRTKAKSGTGSIEIVGPHNSTTPDVATYGITWSVGPKSSIKAKPTPA